MNPSSAADSRPNNAPFYIDNFCPKCKTALVLVDIFETPLATIDDIWHDEFSCPICNDGVYMDWPNVGRDNYK